MRDLEHIIVDRIVELEERHEEVALSPEYRHTIRTEIAELRYVLDLYDRQNCA